MEIIGHTAGILKNKNALEHFLIAYPCHKIEMDFVLTKDGVLVWEHQMKLHGKMISKCQYKEFSFLLTLEDVLEILNNEIDLLIEIKYFQDFYGERFSLLLKALEILENCDYSSIHSFNPNLIRKLLKFKLELPISEVGLIVNLFKTFYYRNGNIQGLEKLDFLSLSSELYEWKNVGKDYLRYRKLFPNAKQYAWTWDKFYHENGDRIQNYLDKNVDGIITTEPALVRALIK